MPYCIPFFPNPWPLSIFSISSLPTTFFSGKTFGFTATPSPSVGRDQRRSTGDTELQYWIPTAVWKKAPHRPRPQDVHLWSPKRDNQPHVLCPSRMPLSNRLKQGRHHHHLCWPSFKPQASSPVCSCERVAQVLNDTYITDSPGCLSSHSNNSVLRDDKPRCLVKGPIGKIGILQILPNSFSTLSAASVVDFKSSQIFTKIPSRFGISSPARRYNITLIYIISLRSYPWMRLKILVNLYN